MPTAFISDISIEDTNFFTTGLAHLGGKWTLPEFIASEMGYGCVILCGIACLSLPVTWATKLADTMQ